MSEENQDPQEIDMSRYVLESEVKDTTDVYPMHPYYAVPVRLRSMPDIKTGGERLRKHGIVCTFGLVPRLDAQAEPILVASQSLTSFFVDADNYEDLKQRVLNELDNMLRVTEAIDSGELVLTEAMDRHDRADS